MTNRPAKGLSMREHAFDQDSGRCIVCGQLAKQADANCPGVPDEEDCHLHCTLPDPDKFTPPEEYDAERDAADEYFESFTHDPDKQAFNIICPVCAHRPCKDGCRLGFSKDDMDELAGMFPVEE